jgi:hypothetical protein
MPARDIITHGFGFGGAAFIPTHGFTPGVDATLCLTVDTRIRFRYGTGRHWGTGWKYGAGDVADPGVPCGDPCHDVRFALEHEDTKLTAPTVLWEEGTLFFFNAAGELSIRHGGYPNEIFYLQAPNGTPYQVTVDGDTGDMTYIENITGPFGKTILDDRGTLWRFTIDNDEIIHLVTDQATIADSIVVPTFTVDPIC